MKNKIKVFLNSGNHSTGRGVGIYAENLAKYLSLLPEIELNSVNPDIVHYPFFDLFYPTLPIIKAKPTVVTIHDLTPLVLPDLYPRGIRGNLNLIHQRLSLLNIKAIITDSNNSKKDLIRIFKLPVSKIQVIYLAADPLFNQKINQSKLIEIKKKYHLPDKFILTVPGGPNPNKNLPLLAKATQELKLPLVIVGKAFVNQEQTNLDHPELKDLRELKRFPHLLYPGFVSTSDLVYFYRLASLYCQPSLYEGFGLPLLEAMSADCLIVSADTSSLPELYGEGTITFDPKNLNMLINSLQKAQSLSAREKEKFIISGKKQAAKFTWEQTAINTSKVYFQIISK